MVMVLELQPASHRGPMKGGSFGVAGAWGHRMAEEATVLEKVGVRELLPVCRGLTSPYERERMRARRSRTTSGSRNSKVKATVPQSCKACSGGGGRLRSRSAEPAGVHGAVQ